MLAIEILMKAIVVALAILQEQRRGLGLPGPVTTIEESRMIVGIAHFAAERVVPAIGDRGERGIERAAQIAHDVGKGVAEIFVLATPEAMARHHDPAAEAALLVVDSGQCRALA